MTAFAIYINFAIFATKITKFNGVVDYVDANKIIEAQRRELQLKAIEQFKTNRTPENSARKTGKER